MAEHTEDGRSAVLTPDSPTAGGDDLTNRVGAGDSESGSSLSNRRVLGGALALFSIQPLTWAASLLMVVYVPQFLGSAALGQLAILTALSGFLSTLIGLGVPTVLVRQIAASPDEAPRLAAGSLALLGFGAVVVGIGLSAVIRAFGLLDVPPWTLEVAMVGMALALFQTLLLSILNGQHRLGSFARLSAGTALASAVGALAALAAGGGLLGMMAVGPLIGMIVCALAWRSLQIQIDWSGVNWPAIRGLAVAGLPFAGMALVLRLRGDSEVMLLGIGLSVEVLGWWSAAERISYVALFVPTLLMTPLLPALSSVATDMAAFRNTLRRSLDVTVVLTLGASAGIAAIAPAVPTALGWGPEFVAAIPLIELLSMVTPLVSIGMILGTALIALGDERRWFVTSTAASSLHLIVTPAAILAFNHFWSSGGIGAATAKLVIEASMLVGALYLLPRGTVPRSSWVVAAKTCAASAVMMVAVRFVLQFESWTALPLAIGTGGVLFLAVLAALRIVPREEIGEVVGFVRQTLRRKRE